MPDIRNINIGPAWAYFGAQGSEVNLGWTQGGIALKVETNTTDIEVDQESEPVMSNITSRLVSVTVPADGKTHGFGQVGDVDDRSVADDDKPLQQIFKLPDVAGPGIQRQGRQGLRRRTGDGLGQVEEAAASALVGFEKVENVLDAAFQIFAENPDYVRLMRREAIDGGQHLGIDLAAALRPLFDRAVAYFRREMDAGNFRQHDAEQLLLRVSEVVITQEAGVLGLTAEAAGEKIDPKRHDLNADVKAVTLHRFRIRNEPDGWTATVVLDI